ncbi:hypothetical protein MJ561_00455 [Klebsiella pneumoniae]|nr:hypothetical protein MJ561_00455 [Klebsiella pneumoniae]
MNAVLSVQGSAVPEKNKPSFLSRVFTKRKPRSRQSCAAGCCCGGVLPGCCVMATTTATDLMKSGDATVKGTFGKSSSVVKWWFWQKSSPAASCT